MQLPTLLILAAVTLAQDARPALKDPAPATVREVSGAAAGPAEDFPELTSVAAPGALAAGAVTEDWPEFLGPRRDGISRETRLLTEWPATGPRLLWTVERGQGFASPAVAAGRVVFPHRVGGETHVECLEAETGKRFWRHSFPTAYRGRYISDSGPRATPTIAAGKVFVHGVEGSLHALDLASGAVIWQRDLKAEFELEHGFFGVVSSPLVNGSELVVNLGVPGGPSVVAFDVATGRLLWGAGTKWGASCASPVLADLGAGPRLLVMGGGDSRPPSGGLMVIDPERRTLDFEYPFRSRTYESVIGATPVVAGKRVFLTAAYSTGTAAIAWSEDAGYRELWKNRRVGIEFSTPVFVDGHLYLVEGVHDRAGAIVCVDPSSGEVKSRTDLDWEEELTYQGKTSTRAVSIGAGSMLHAAGRFLVLGDNGHLLWVEAKPEGARVLARASLFRANQTWAPPVLSHGLLYVCQNRPERFGDQPARLLCFDLRGE